MTDWLAEDSNGNLEGTLALDHSVEMIAQNSDHRNRCWEARAVDIAVAAQHRSSTAGYIVHQVIYSN